jgi:hypothetical protein
MRVQWIPLILVGATGCSDLTDSGVVLEVPGGVSSVSLDGAIALTWSDGSYVSDPDHFENYRVYSTGYDLDRDLCGTSWSLEGTTVAPEFIVGALANGDPRCFAVSAMSKDGVETERSPSRADTPRPDARNVALYAWQVDDLESGFRFWDDQNDDGIVQSGELGLVRSGSSSTIDFRVSRKVDGSLVLQPIRAGTGVEFYEPSSAGPALVEDLTSIDFAPDQTYRTTEIEAVPGYGYVFEMDAGDEFARYGAVRVTHVGASFILFDWAFQTDPGNPELRVVRR